MAMVDSPGSSAPAVFITLPNPQAAFSPKKFRLHTDADWDNITPSAGIQTYPPKLPQDCTCPQLLMLKAIDVVCVCVMGASGGLL